MGTMDTIRYFMRLIKGQVFYLWYNIRRIYILKQITTKNERVCPICSCSEKNLLYKQNFTKNKDISLIENYDV